MDRALIHLYQMQGKLSDARPGETLSPKR
jgi:hypothetical protein